MGPRASSKGKRCHELVGCPAVKNHSNSNVGRYLGGPKSDARNPVQLVRTRTLSSDLDDGRPWRAKVSNGVTLGSLVLQGVRAELRRLLGDTQPVLRWQEPLRQLLQTYLMPEEARRALSFLTENMDTACRAVMDPAHSAGYPALFIDIKNKPTVFHIDCWKKIMMGLYFEITEPESNRQLDLIEVKVTKHVTLAPLVGFKILLQSLSNLSWETLRMLLSLTTDEALRLLAAIQGVLAGRDSRHHDVIEGLHARYPDQLSALGFDVIRVKGSKEVTWQPPSSDCIHHLHVALAGLHHDGSGLETYI